MTLLRPVLDLTMRQWTRTRGDLTVIGTWYGTEVAGSEPCLVIIPTFRSRGFQPAVICLSSAWRWEHDPRHVAQKTIEFVAGLGLPAEAATCLRLASLINDHLDDLVKLPPRPHTREIVGADALIRDSETGKVEHAQIVHRV